MCTVCVNTNRFKLFFQACILFFILWYEIIESIIKEQVNSAWQLVLLTVANYIIRKQMTSQPVSDVPCYLNVYKYSRISIGSNHDCLIRIHSWSLNPYMRILWSNFYIYVSCRCFQFSIFTDRLKMSQKIENENNSTKALTVQNPYIEPESLVVSY